MVHHEAREQTEPETLSAPVFAASSFQAALRTNTGLPGAAPGVERLGEGVQHAWWPMKAVKPKGANPKGRVALQGAWTALPGLSCPRRGATPSPSRSGTKAAQTLPGSGANSIPDPMARAF